MENAENYNLPIGDILAAIKNPTISFDTFKSNLYTLATETIASKSGLSTGSIYNAIKDPKTLETQFIDAGIHAIEGALGVPADSLTKSYKGSPSILIGKIISQKTGIDSLTDSNAFLTGDIEHALKAWGLAEFKKEINADLSNPAASIAYDVLAKAAFGDKGLEDKAVDQILKSGGINGSKDAYVNQAVRTVQIDLQKKANFGIMDAQLIKKDKDIPVGFSEKILTGSDQDRLDLLKDFAIKKADLTDEKLNELTGINLPKGTAADLAKYAKGDITADQLKTNLASSGQAFAAAQLLSWGDKTLGFAPGTTQALYTNYQQYQKLQNAFSTGKLTSDQFHSSQIALAVTVVDTVTGGAITKATSPVDEALGLPSGTTLQLAMAMVTGNYAQAAFIVVGAVLGFGKMKCPDLQKLAREKVNALLNETMQYSLEQKKANPGNPAVPSQILTFREEDILNILPSSQQLYGPKGYNFKSGVFESLNPQEIHVGF